MRIFTISETVEQLKRDSISLTEYRLRQLIKNDVIPHISCGQKFLIDYDYLIQFLTNATSRSDFNNAPTNTPHQANATDNAESFKIKSSRFC